MGVPFLRSHNDTHTDISCVTLPPVTRILLRTDGSTTQLLEALLEEPLALNLIDQDVVAAEELPARVADVLGCQETDPVVRRRSTLQTYDARTVSRNAVTVLCTDPQLTSVLTDRHLPIGHALAASGQYLGRTVLATGWADWPDDQDTAWCVFKEYVLLDHTARPVAHVHERFNPAHVPSGAPQ